MDVKKNSPSNKLLGVISVLCVVIILMVTTYELVCHRMLKWVSIDTLSQYLIASLHHMLAALSF